ncbi:MAG: trypsin-like serine protease [Sedimenticola sp.]
MHKNTNYTLYCKIPSIFYDVMLFLLAVFIALPTAAANLPGGGERNSVDAASPPWSATGRVNSAGIGHCTDVLIVPDRVLTAAHCIWNRRAGTPFPVTELHFLAGYQKERYVAHGRVSAISISPHYNADEPDRLRRAESDWTVITLSRPLVGVEPLTVAPIDHAALQRSHPKGIRIE